MTIFKTKNINYKIIIIKHFIFINFFHIIFNILYKKKELLK